MEGLIITAFVFCMVGVIALMRIEKVIKILKEKEFWKKTSGVTCRKFMLF